MTTAAFGSLLTDIRAVLIRACRRLVGFYQIWTKLEEIEASFASRTPNGDSIVHPIVAPPTSHFGSVPKPLLERTLQNLRGRRNIPLQRDIPVSAFVISYNDLPTLEATLLSIQSCQQVVVIDKSSDDRSFEIAALYATDLKTVAWTPTVEHTRQIGDSLCQFEWRIFLDGDEFLSDAAVNVLRFIGRQESLNLFPYDVVILQLENYLNGEKAERNIYAPRDIARIYRKGAYNFDVVTHGVGVIPGARILRISPDAGAKIYHFNQDNLFEYFEKMNRYTETYRSEHALPSTADDVFKFSRDKLDAAEASVRSRNGHVFDAVWEVATALYYQCEYLKQIENTGARSPDAAYSEIVGLALDKSSSKTGRQHLIGELESHFRTRGEAATFPKVALKSILPSAPIIIEAGSYDGMDAREFGLLFPAGEVYGFEPSPDLFETCVKNTADLHNVSIYPGALSDRDGEAQLFVSSGTSDGSSSLLIPKDHLNFHPSVKFDQNITVRTLHLGRFLNQKRVSLVHFLWLDLQGVELHVLKTIEEHLPNLVGAWVECSIAEVYEGCTRCDDLSAYFARFGLEPAYRQMPWKDAGNILFLNRTCA
jgi:FkbM family methyltransferase